jgi:hypothetical protein
VKILCKCEDCRILEDFSQDPKSVTHKFRVREDRRAHLHRTIEKYGLDMDHVTERTGSPHTLVCTKTRRSYKRRCNQFRNDVTWLKTLEKLVSHAMLLTLKTHVSRIKAAIVRAKNWKE